MNIGLGIWIGNPPAYVTGVVADGQLQQENTDAILQEDGSDLLVEA